MDRRKFLISAGTAAVTVGLAGCTGEDPDFEGSEGGNGDGSDGGSVEDDIELLEHELVFEDEGTDFASVSIEGRARNNSDENLGYVEIRGRFYNAQGDLLDSMIDNINDFGAGQTWSFEIQFPGIGDDANEVDDYDVAVGTSF